MRRRAKSCALGRLGFRRSAIGLTVAMLAGCASPGSMTQVGPLPAPQVPGTEGARPPRFAQRFDDAVASLAFALFPRAQMDPPGEGNRYPLVIDPPLDSVTGEQSAATGLAAARITAMVRERYARFQSQEFGGTGMAEKPVVLLATLDPVTEEGGTTPLRGARPQVYRLSAVLADLRSGSIVSEESAWVRPEGVDTAPTAFFRDSPVWLADASSETYARAAGGTLGSAMDGRYLRSFRSQAVLASAMRAHDAGRYDEALASYAAAARLPGGDQLRARNGVYLAQQRLGRGSEAEAAFGDLVDYGLDRGRLAVRFVFEPGSTVFLRDQQVSSQYPIWLRQIARRVSARETCLDVVGHASPTGSTLVNERLSLARAQRVRGRLTAEDRALRPRTVAQGLGEREPIVGTGTNDLTDALDRRVEFRTLSCDELGGFRGRSTVAAMTRLGG